MREKEPGDEAMEWRRPDRLLYRASNDQTQKIESDDQTQKIASLRRSALFGWFWAATLGLVFVAADLVRKDWVAGICGISFIGICLLNFWFALMT